MALPPSLHELASGIYVEASGADRIRGDRGAAASQLADIVIAGGAIRTKRDFLRAWAGAFRFPDYFGLNWDAFYDCAFDLSGLPPGDQLIIYDQFDPFARADPDDWAIARRLLLEVAAGWRSESRRVIVLLRGSPALAPDLPLAFLSDAARAGLGWPG